MCWLFSTKHSHLSFGYEKNFLPRYLLCLCDVFSHQSNFTTTFHIGANFDSSLAPRWETSLCHGPKYSLKKIFPIFHSRVAQYLDTCQLLSDTWPKDMLIGYVFPPNTKRNCVNAKSGKHLTQRAWNIQNDIDCRFQWKTIIANSTMLYIMVIVGITILFKQGQTCFCFVSFICIIEKSWERIIVWGGGRDKYLIYWGDKHYKNN